MSHLRSHLEFLLSPRSSNARPRDANNTATLRVLLPFLPPFNYHTRQYTPLYTMPAEYAEYLAANVLNEQQLVCLSSRLAMLLRTNT
jgi:hypothetical protein